MDEWDTFSDLNTKLAAPVAPYELPPQYNRKTMRSMGAGGGHVHLRATGNWRWKTRS